MMQAVLLLCAVFRRMTAAEYNAKVHRRLVILVAFIGICEFLLIVRVFRKAIRCSAVVDAEIIDAELEKGGGFRPRDAKVYTFAPVYRYEYEGREYRVTSDSSYNKASVKIGKKLQLRIDPQDPTQYFYWKKSLTDLLFRSIAIVLFAFFLYFAIPII